MPEALVWHDDAVDSVLSVRVPVTAPPAVRLPEAELLVGVDLGAADEGAAEAVGLAEDGAGDAVDLA